MDARERQDALVGFLRARGTTTVAEAARAFDVSTRTLTRDLDRLRARDIPIDADRGRGGGIRIDPSRAVPAVRLTLDEVIGLVLAVALARRTSALPFGRSARDGVDKLLATLPKARARGLDRLLARVVIGPPASAAVIASLAPARPAVLECFEKAFHLGRTLAFTYVDRNGATSRREVEPHGLLVQVPAWYVLGLDVARDLPRMFRLDRMSRPAVLEQAFTPRPFTVFEPLLTDVRDRTTLSAR